VNFPIEKQNRCVGVGGSGDDALKNRSIKIFVYNFLHDGIVVVGFVAF
jgi:hypothetical protein